MRSQLETFVTTRLRETAADLDVKSHMEVVGDLLHKYAPERYEQMREWEATATLGGGNVVPDYTVAVAEDLLAVGIQLQAKNRDLWDTYDRNMAEAQFRYGIAPPLTLIILILAWQSDNWWAFLLIAPAILFQLGYRHFFEAASTLVQAIVLKMVEPPVLERLREVLAKKEEDAAKSAAGSTPADAENGGVQSETKP
jgi:hypothetical protein